MTATGTFDVVGARTALAQFGSLDADRLAHGYLFAGPPGAGKKTFARRLAQSLLCETPKPTLLGYCSACAGCTMFAAATHPDYTEWIGAIKIGERDGRGDDVTSRELVRVLGLRGYRGERRVLVLGDVEFAAPAAANALLKFFEEPPAGVVLIVTSAAPGTIIATIRSRLVEVPFAPISTAEIAAVLERAGAAGPLATEIAQAANGNLSLARSIASGDGVDVRSAACDWFAAALAGKSVDHAFLRLDDRGLSASERRAALAEFLAMVRVAARDYAALTIAGDVAPLMWPGLARRGDADRERDPHVAARVLTVVAEAERLAHTNVTATLVLDYLRMQLAPPAA